MLMNTVALVASGLGALAPCFILADITFDAKCTGSGDDYHVAVTKTTDTTTGKTQSGATIATRYHQLGSSTWYTGPSATTDASGNASVDFKTTLSGTVEIEVTATFGGLKSVPVLVIR